MRARKFSSGCSVAVMGASGATLNTPPDSRPTGICTLTSGLVKVPLKKSSLALPDLPVRSTVNTGPSMSMR